MDGSQTPQAHDRRPPQDLAGVCQGEWVPRDVIDVPAPLSWTPDLHSDFSNSKAEDVGSDNKQTQVKK